MPTEQISVKMPELPVFAKLVAVGFVIAEVARVAFSLGTNFAPTLDDANPWLVLLVLAVSAWTCILYLVKRGVLTIAGKLLRSGRVDLAAMVIIGIASNELATPWLDNPHKVISEANPNWAPTIGILLFVLLASPLCRALRNSTKAPPLYFISDDEIHVSKDDLLSSQPEASSFAESVLASGAHPGLVFGVEGPWGIGKTSFINLAERHWESSNHKIIVCRFEPLRYASEKDLSVRLIRDVSAAIQRKVFAPEFGPVTSRYSALIQGKSKISFFGFEINTEPSKASADDLLDDIDLVLKQIDHRVIIVIDDLDRLDAKSVNNVLFATKRTFKLSRATYILCYDTEILTRNTIDSQIARAFLEKFVAIKISLLVDRPHLREFMTNGWKQASNQLDSVPSETIINLGSLLSELANMLHGDDAAKYMPLVGDLRKVKRFINALLMAQIEKTDLGETDFNKRDLIHLMLIHLNFPWVFRQIYSEETDGLRGIFSMRKNHTNSQFENAGGFRDFLDTQSNPATKFLLEQLFSIEVLRNALTNDENEIRSRRACINDHGLRNLEKYLTFIVRFKAPPLRETLIHYENNFTKFKNGIPIKELLDSEDLGIHHGEDPHDKFWRLLVNRSSGFDQRMADQTIDALVDYLPKYSVTRNDFRGLRLTSIYSLSRLLDRAGWGRGKGEGRHIPNSPENIVEIAWRIFGENKYSGTGLIDRLTAPERGILGWNDLMIFRLQCSADRNGQLFNLHSALIVDQDNTTERSGDTRKLALLGMRRLSQEVFARFKKDFINSKRNFFQEVEALSDEEILGNTYTRKGEAPDHIGKIPQEFAVGAARSLIRSFVIYQLSSTPPPAGSGVGCGHYDERGAEDQGEIGRLMSEYVFNYCFNPEIDCRNLGYFLDYCLTQLTSTFFTDLTDDTSYVPTKKGLPGPFDSNVVARYWQEHGSKVNRKELIAQERVIATPNYTASYHEDLYGVFQVLDELAITTCDDPRPHET